MDPQEREIFEMRKAAAALELQTMGYHNYDTTIDYDEQYIDAGSALNYDPNLSFDEDYEESVLNMMGRYTKRGGLMPKGQITYDLQINYVNVATNLPVRVTLFQLNFNEGTFVGSDLVFSNAGGDTATVVGITSSFRALMERSRTQQFRINYVRMNPVAAGQFGAAWRFDFQSVWGGGKFNNLTPKTFITPLQFQLLRVDVPINYDIDEERGFSFDVQTTEIAANGGLQMTLFIDRINNPTMALKGKQPVQNLTGKGIMESQAASADPIRNAQKLLALRKLALTAPQKIG